MANNLASAFQGDITNYIQGKLLRLQQRQLVAYQFGEKIKLDEGHGLNYTATRFNRLPLPYAPLAEGVPASGESMTISQVTGTVQQWGDLVRVTDVAELTIKHKPFQQAVKLVRMQVAEMRERNTYLGLLAFSQVNYVNSRGSRSALVAGDVLDTTTVLRTTAALATLGAPKFGGPAEDNIMVDIRKGGGKASNNPRQMEHYVSVMHTLVVSDFRQNPTVISAWTYSDVNRLYNYEAGEWSGIRFCYSNMVPFWTGVAAIQGTAGISGSLATGTYYVTVTASDTQNQYESRIYQVSNAITVTGPNGSISVVLPALTGYTFSVYVGTTATPMNLGLCSAGPVQGPLAGQATQIAAGQTVTITGTGVAQVPPAAPGTGLTVYPTFVFGEDSYGIIELQPLKINYLNQADKSDPQNQQRIIAWTSFEGMIIQNQSFACRIESVSAFSSAFG